METTPGPLNEEGMARRRTDRLRRCLRSDEGAAASQVGTLLLVIITIVLSTVVGGFAFGLVKFPEPPPTLDYISSHVPNRWNIHISSVSEQFPISGFRLITTKGDGDFVVYDTDGDAVPDSLLVAGLTSLVVLSAAGPQHSPLVYVDADADGNVSPGDFMVAYQPFYTPFAPFLDATRGYQVVDPAPGGIPRGSQLLIVASSTTLSGGTIDPWDTVRVTLDKGGPFEVTKEGIVSACGVFVALVDVETTWVPATYMQTTFTVRPGEADEWSESIPLKVRMDEPLTLSEREWYDAVARPLGFGDVITLVHTGSNTVVLRLRL